MSKVYYNHTHTLPPVREGLRPAATIALKRVGNDFHYGIAICSKYDNFSKKYGRKVAEERLEKKFRISSIPKDLLSHEEQLGEQGIILIFLYQLAKAVTINSKKWKKKVTKFNLEQAREAAQAKVVIMNATSSENNNN